MISEYNNINPDKASIEINEESPSIPSIRLIEFTISKITIIVKGIPKLGGEELERMTSDNYYEVRYIDIKDIDSYDINAKNLIKKEYQEF